MHLNIVEKNMIEAQRKGNKQTFATLYAMKKEIIEEQNKKGMQRLSNKGGY